MVALANSAIQYVGSDKWTSVTAWAATTAKTAGALVRQSAAPTLGNERVFVCIIAGTTLGSEPTWTVTKGATTAEPAGPTWQECTGQPGINGDITNSPVWGATLTVVKGQTIYDATSGALQICSTAGTTKSGAQPSFSATAGVTTTDNTATWTSLGAHGNFAAFAAPHKRILNADAATWQTVIPATIYISNSHAETQASNLTLAGGQGTTASPNRYICVSNAAAPPTSATTGASVATTGATDNLSISGFGYYYGVLFSAGDTTNSANINVNPSTDCVILFESCTLKLNSSGAAAAILLGPQSTQAGALIRLLNTSFIFGASTQLFRLESGFIYIAGGSLCASGTVIATAFTLSAGNGATVEIRDLDLSAITGNIINIGLDLPSSLLLENSKINATVGMTTGTFAPGALRFKMHNCDSGTKNYRFYEADYYANIQSETTTINTAGASDGTQGLSWKIITSANAKFGQPYVSPEISQWQDTTGSSKTATIEIAGATTLTNGDIWMELEYPGSSASPIGSLVTSRVADAVTSVSNVTSSTASWGGSPASTQKLQVTFTPQMKGPIKARIFLAKASTTVFVDPLITVT